MRIDQAMITVNNRLGGAKLAGRVIEKPHDVAVQRGPVIFNAST
jgi:hypothetical protein